MRYNPEALDYEGVFPPRRSYPREGEPVEQRTLFNQPEVEIASNRAPGSLSDEAEARPSFVSLEAGKWQARKGHSLTFACLFVFSMVLYFRPYELIPALSSFKTMTFYISIVLINRSVNAPQASVGSIANGIDRTARPREVNMVLLVGRAVRLPS